MIFIFNEFFIAIGEAVLQFITFLRDFSFKNNDEKKQSVIFSAPEVQKKDDNAIERIRDKILPYTKNRKIMVLLVVIILILGVFTAFEISGIIAVVLLMIYVFIMYYPQIKEKNSYSDMNQNLPYALRHMGIELKSGKGLHDCFLTIRNSNYGSLSNEFNRVLEEIKFGKSTEDSLLEMSERVGSDGLTRTIHQIIGALRVGGNVANNLEIIAKDISFEMQIKLKEYSQKLNSFILIYTFIAILAPVISLIMLMAGSTVMGDIISGSILIMIYGVFFPMVVMFMGVFVKKLEPKI